MTRRIQHFNPSPYNGAYCFLTPFADGLANWPFRNPIGMHRYVCQPQYITVTTQMYILVFIIFYLYNLYLRRSDLLTGELGNIRQLRRKISLCHHGPPKTQPCTQPISDDAARCQGHRNLSCMFAHASLFWASDPHPPSVQHHSIFAQPTVKGTTKQAPE